MKWFKELWWLFLILLVWTIAVGYDLKQCPRCPEIEPYTKWESKYFEKLRPMLKEMWSGEIDWISLDRGRVTIFYPKPKECNVRVEHKTIRISPE